MSSGVISKPPARPVKSIKLSIPSVSILSLIILSPFSLLFTSFKLWSGKCRRNGKDDKR